jgi:hypothetical protein
MDSESFFVTLPSDASINIFPANRQNHYHIKLPKPLDLQDKWEVALMEIIYPRQVININDVSQETGFQIIVTDPAIQRKIEHVALPTIKNSHFIKATNDDSSRVYHFEIPSGHYYSATHLVEVIENIYKQTLGKVLEDFSIKLSLKYSKIHNKVTIYYTAATKTKVGIRFDDGLSAKLGLENWTKGTPLNALYRDEIAGTRCVDLDAGLSALYIYTDIADYQTVGNVAVPLLRAIPFDVNVAGQGDNVRTHAHWECTHPHYVRVRKHYFDTLEIDIRNDFGLPMPFIKGKTLVKLHFRQVQSRL